MLRFILTASLWTVVCLLVAALYLCVSFKGVSRAVTASSTEEDDDVVKTRQQEPTLTLAAEVFDQKGGSFQSLETLQTLVQQTKVIVIAIVKDDEEQAALLAWLSHNGVLDLIPRHRVLFCESPASRTTIVRQLNPVLHLESNTECMELMGRVESIRAAQVPDPSTAWGFLGTWGKNLA